VKEVTGTPEQIERAIAKLVDKGAFSLDVRYEVQS
jgi:hypothetical protein